MMRKAAALFSCLGGTAPAAIIKNGAAGFLRFILPVCVPFYPACGQYRATSRSTQAP